MKWKYRDIGTNWYFPYVFIDVRITEIGDSLIVFCLFVPNVNQARLP